ncbi:thioester reductase domain-containing protein [Actinophytocola oryzae]|uniref:Thioester reductase-like protein n=1 Tax=Actinophytocola oryzae TaxID=502181 RepID=A0A4R7V3C7_9PSEU|nr:thioester reductase domain-containing protein [Actinophytocola oryzae]TDV43184.1 thioester reductase-like protein [Actinophytocola oryzae]
MPVPHSEPLLTGATGFFGAFLLTELLATTGTRVNCLVRAKDEPHARQRIRQNLLRYHRWDPALADRLAVTVGNLAEPRLGLDDDAFTGLAERTGVIYHNGATVNHLLPLSHVEASNVGGTETLLELADATATRTLHYLSANAVADGHDTGYVESKRLSEKKVLAAAAGGTAASVYRLPRVAPDTWTGIPNENDITVRMINMILQVGSAPDITFTEIWVAADVAASTIVGAAGLARGGETFSLWSREKVSMPYLLAIAEEAGFTIPLLPLEEWLERVHAINASEHEVTLGVLGLDALADAQSDDGPGDERYGELVEAPMIARSALVRYFQRCRAGF